MNIKDYIKENLKLKIERTWVELEVSITIENEIIDTIVLPDLLEVERRMKNRIDKQIPDSVLFDMIKRFSPPLKGEGFHNIEYRF